MKSSLLVFLFSCAFIPVYSQTPDCSLIIVASGGNTVNVSGINSAAIVGVQVFNQSWSSVFNQTYTSHGDNITTSVLPAGQYYVNVRFYNNSWSPICEKSANVTLTGTTPPPTENCNPTFLTLFGNAGGDEYGNDIVRTVDGYIIAGKASVGDGIPSNAIIMKTDFRGIPVWAKHYGAGGEDLFYSIITTTDGGFLAAGMTKSFGNPAGDPWLVKTDATGNVLWQKRFTNNSSPGFVYGVIQTSDAGYALSGTFPNSPGSSDWMVIKTDPTGNIQWQKRIGTSQSDEGVNLIEDDHGGAGIIVTGNTSSTTNYDGSITKFDLSNGNMLWSKTYDFDRRSNRFGSIFKVADGFIIRAANHDGFGEDNAIQMILKTDFNGNVVLRKEFQAPGCKDGQFVILPDGGFMLAMGEPTFSSNPDIHLMRVDAAWNIVWTKRYSREGNQRIYGMILDGNSVLATGVGASGTLNDVLLLKCDLSGNIGSCTATSETGISKVPSITTMASPWSTVTDWSLVSTNTNFLPAAVNMPATVLCIDSCAVPKIASIGNVTINENAGDAILQVCLSAPYADTLFFQYTSGNGTATSNADFIGGTWTVAFLPGQTCTNIAVPIINDSISEQTESFTVSIGQVSGTVTINDDDVPQFDCKNINLNPGNNQITVTGIVAPIVTVQIFNSSWSSVYSQTYSNSPGSVNIPINPGTYHVKVAFYNSNWILICDKSQDATVVNQCPPGANCISNICPAQSVDLNNAYSIPNLPSGTTVSWHTGTPATDANRLTPAQAQNVTTSGTYYAAINISGANCYSNTIPVTVTITPCSSSSANGSLQVRSTDMNETNKITAFPNPFTNSIRVVIPSVKGEKATVDLVDMLGRPLKTMTVQLVPGSNQVMVTGLEKYPSGSYFIRVKLVDKLETLKVLREK